MLQTYELLKERNSKFNDWENKQTSKLNFKDKIIQPIQRLPRYGLFIKDLLKHTPGNHLKLSIYDPPLLIMGSPALTVHFQPNLSFESKASINGRPFSSGLFNPKENQEPMAHGRPL